MPLFILSFARWLAIIGALSLAFSLSGCSAVRLAYSNAPTLTYWWVDGYFDFDSTQSTRVRADLQALQDWHRKEELPLYAQVLKNVQASASKTVTPDEVCSLYSYALARMQMLAERAAPTLAALAPTLESAQLEHVAHAFDKRNREWRAEWMDGTPAERTQRRVDKLVERAESFYGRLDAAQLAAVRANVTQSLLDVELSYRETLRRQQDTLQTLRDIRTGNMAPERAQAAVRALLARSFNSPDPVYRKYLADLTTQSCTAVAQLHNSTSAAQRVQLVLALRDYEDDVRALLPPSTGQTTP